MKWQDLRVGQRMATAFGTIALVVGVGVALTLQLAGQERRLADEVDQATQISVLAEQARYQVADATGWQALVIADVASFGPTKALDPSSYNMAGLIDQKIIQDWLDGLDVDAATNPGAPGDGCVALPACFARSRTRLPTSIESVTIVRGDREPVRRPLRTGLA